jgi:hypothetical protein
VVQPIVEPIVEPMAQPIVEVAHIERPLFLEITPKYIFIVPYRDREPEMNIFIDNMINTILVDYNKYSYNILFVHQLDNRLFNRGAMKNIGFITSKMNYPTTYKNITLIFNDIDTMPKKKNQLNYETTHNVAKHFYGFRFSLGGIVSMKAADYEKCNGFPNFYGYAYEDNLLYKRCQNKGIDIDRSNFFEIGDNEITHSNRTGPLRNIKRSEFDRFIANTEEGIYQITQLKYTVEQIADNIGFVNVATFNTPYPYNPDENVLYDTRITSQPFKPTNKQVRNQVQPFLRMQFIK